MATMNIELTQFTNEETEQMNRIMQIYPSLKKLLNYSEKIDNGSTFIPPLTDIRRSLDHIMTFLAIKYNLVENPPGIAIQSNDELKKVIADLQRAMVTVTDYINVNQKDQLDKLIKDISPVIVNEMCPYIHGEIYPKIYKLQGMLEDSSSGFDSLDVEKLQTLIDEIFEIRIKLISVEKIQPILADRQNAHDTKIAEDNKIKADEDKKTIYINLAGAAIAACIGAVVGALFVYLLR